MDFTQDLFAAEASPYYAAFLQDTYHIRHNLTITAGVRWDIFGGKTERHNRLEYFDPTAWALIPAVAEPFTGGEVFSTSGNRSPFTTNLMNFAPRLGFSWQPEKHLVVRGGAGFYFGPSAQMVGGAILNSDGYSTSNNWNATCTERRRQYRDQRHLACATGRAAAERDRPLFADRSLPIQWSGSCSAIPIAPDRIDDRSWRNSDHHAALAANAGDL